MQAAAMFWCLVMSIVASCCVRNGLVSTAGKPSRGDWDGLHAVGLGAEELFPVCSPRLVRGRQRLREPSDLLKFPLLHLDSHKDWTRWLAAAGVTSSKPSSGLVLNRPSMLIDAAIDGQGITLARTVLASWDLLHGRLIKPFALTLPLAKGFWLVCPKATSMLPKIMSFRDWLLTEAKEDARRLEVVAK